ncbi:MAG: S8 family serine peptidase [Caldisericia bacterium]|nr:S8 family serine peptidase [Caldisericia bacterium]
MLKRFCVYLIVCSFLFGLIPFSIQSAQASHPKIDVSYLEEVKNSSQEQTLILQFKEDPVVPYSEKHQVHLHSICSNNDTSAFLFDTTYGASLEKKQLEIFQSIQGKMNVELLHTYQYIYNGIAIKTAGYNIPYLLKNPSIQGIFSAMEEDYSSRIISTATISANEVWDMKAKDQSTVTGQGSRVGIIDSGIDYNHADFTPTGVGEKSRVKVGYDFADGTSDCKDAGFGGIAPPHGTHVAGITSGKNPDREEKRGVAPESDLYVYKVFSKEGGGANPANIIKAAEQSVKDKCDVINLSLGHSTDGSSDESGNPYYDALYNADKAGTMVVAAAGNAGTRHKKNPWPIDAPGVFDFVLQVSASDDRMHQSFVFSTSDGNDLTSNAYRARYSPAFPSKLNTHNNTKLVDCAFGAKGEFPSAVKGNIAFISRGPKNNGLSFQEKNLNAKAAGAIGCIVYNYDPDPFGGLLIDPRNGDKPEDFEFIPCIFISGIKADSIKKHLDEDYELSFPVGSDVTFSDFSSTGPSFSADDNVLKPEICAPGKQINSAVLNNKYEDWDGTSMATPFVSGCVALTRQVHPSWKPQQIKRIFMHSSDLLKNFVNDQYVSYFLQGAGQVNVQNATTSPIEMDPAYIMHNNEEFDKPFTVSITNIIEKEVTLSLSAEIFDNVLVQLDLDDLPKPETPASFKLSDNKITLKPGETKKIQLTITENEETFTANKYEGALWVDIQNASSIGSSTHLHHLPIIVWKDSLCTIPDSVTDFYFSQDSLNIEEEDTGYVHFVLNAGSAFDLDSGSPQDGRTYNNIATYLSFHAYDQTGVDWGIVKTFEYLPLGEYVFEWDGKSLEGNEFLPDGDFYLAASIKGTRYDGTIEDIYETFTAQSTLTISGSTIPQPPTFLISSPKKLNIGDTFVVNIGFREPFDIQEFEIELQFSRSKLIHKTMHLGDFVDTELLTDKDIEFDKGTFYIKGLRNPAWNGNSNAIIAQLEFEAKRATDTLDVEIVNFVFKDTEGNKRKTLFLLPPFIIEKDSATLGDFNEDGLINEEDFELLKEHYATSWKDKENWDPMYDLNTDYYVNIEDLKIFARYFIPST